MASIKALHRVLTFLGVRTIVDLSADSAAAPLDAATRDFVVAEHKMLREELAVMVKQLVDNQLLSLAASGLIWSWLAVHPRTSDYVPILFLPAALSVLFCLRWLALESGIFGIAAYLRRVELRLKLHDLGWETHVEKAGRGLFSLAHWTYWLALIGGNVAIAVAYGLPR